MKLKNKKIQISCDGGAATGKSTGGKMISKRFKLKFLSSGLLYRYASYLILNHKPKNKEFFLRKKFTSSTCSTISIFKITSNFFFIFKVSGVAHK